VHKPTYNAATHQIHGWYNALFAELRQAIQAGTKPIVLQGHASTGSSVANSQELAK
jgi:hypothetical protein